MMNIAASPTLHSALKIQIQSLIKACEAESSLRFSFPFEDADLFVFSETGGSVPAAAAFSELGSELWECTAFTHPAFRKRGYFQALLEAGLEALPPECDLLFYVNAKSAAAIHAMEALGASVISRELMMEYRFPSGHGAGVQPLLPAAEEAGEDGPVLFYQGFHGSVRIAVYESHYYLYGLEIEPACRGNGNGRKLLSAVMADLYARKPRPIRLQASGENAPALSLYNKAGFRTIETLLCYLY